MYWCHFSKSYQPLSHFPCISDDFDSLVNGFIHNDIFQGKIYTGDGEEYHMEDSKQYFEDPQSHSVIYDVREIVYPTHHVCGYKRAGEGNISTQATQGRWFFAKILFS